MGTRRDPPGEAGGSELPVLRRPLQGPYSAMYGSDIVAARYCGFDAPPAPPSGLWMHGWYPEARTLDRPERLFDVSMAHLRDLQYWVTTERQAAFLRGLGYARSMAIGLPLVYVPPPRVKRRAGSLLVMPAHSLPAHDRSWATTEYVDSIRALVPEFASITVCVNGHDWDRGNWVGEFSRAGFEVIRGAGDETTLYKMAELFSEHEYVTTNGFGSLIAYASAFGAKACFYGPFSEVPADTLRNVPYFMDNPELMAVESACCEEQYCRATFPGFFRHPAEAEAHVEWGRREIGWGNRVPPDELKRLFGWSTVGRVRSRVRTLEERVAASVPEQAREAASALTSPAARARRRELRRLRQMPAGTHGTTPLFGGMFEFTDAATYLQTFDDCFSRELYRFRARSREPLVVDACPGDGLSVLYFKSLYPRCRVVAMVEHEAQWHPLERNCRRFALKNVDVVRGAFACASLDQKPGASPAGHDESSAAPPPVAGVDWIDLLKVRAADDTFPPGEMTHRRLQRVGSVAADFPPSATGPHGLGSLVGVLEEAGFRVTVRTPRSAPTRPLIELAGAAAPGERVTVLAVRP